MVTQYSRVENIHTKNIKVVLCWICNQQEWSTVRPDHWAALGGHIWGVGWAHCLGGLWYFGHSVDCRGVGTLSFVVCVVLVYSKYRIRCKCVTGTLGWITLQVEKKLKLTQNGLNFGLSRAWQVFFDLKSFYGLNLAFLDIHYHFFSNSSGSYFSN